VVSKYLDGLARQVGPPSLNAPRIRHAACWAHARRKLFDEYERTKSPIAEARQNIRRVQALPILSDLKSWMTEQRRRLSSKTGLAKALQYALTRWEALCLYTEDGRLGIDNNPAERGLRTIATTRKNFLFLGSNAGGERAAVIYTVLQSARLNGLDPEAYLANIINRMAKGHPITRLSELLPWNWTKPKIKRAAKAQAVIG
jgi:hypothetical protein